MWRICATSSLPRIAGDAHRALPCRAYASGCDRRTDSPCQGIQESAAFSWRDRAAWRRATANTTRCLIGCSIGDLGRGTIGYSGERVQERERERWSVLPLPCALLFHNVFVFLSSRIGMMLTLQTYAAESMGVPSMMALSMGAGICTSLALETVVLRHVEKFSWKKSATVAWNMSVVRIVVCVCVCV
jgi:Domain of unknown function (DUF4396)